MRSLRRFLVAAVLAFAAASPLPAQLATLLRDVASEAVVGVDAGSGPLDLFAVQGRLFFTAALDSTGREVWVTDGTAVGTRLLADACPGDCDEPVRFVGAVGRLALWIELDSDQLWRSDGTRAGTYPLTTPGVLDAPVEGRSQAVLGNVLYFRGCPPDAPCALWRTDGTREGTRPVAPASGIDLVDMFVAGRYLFFYRFPDPSSLAAELWRTDGTTAIRLAGLPGPPRGTVVAGGRLFLELLVSTPSGTEAQLWVSDGTAAGTRAVARFPSSQGPNDLAPFGSRAAFVIDDGTHGQELWLSDGTAAGTRRVTDFAAAAPFDGSGLAEVGGRLVFAADDGGGRRLWATAGTPASTVAIGTAALPPAGGFSRFTRAGARLVFRGADAARGSELWATDGTAAGTKLLADVCPGSCDGVVANAVPVGGAAYFSGFQPARGYELWKTDGTPGGTRRTTDFASPEAARFFFEIAAIGNRVFFAAGEGAYGRELWASDGTPAGTRLVADLERARATSDPLGLVAWNGGLAWNARQGEARAPWASDGSPEGTRPVPLPFTPSAERRVGVPHPAGGRLFFFAGAEDGDGVDLWRTDGTEGGALALARFDRDVELGPIAGAHGELFFVVDDVELWGSDGTPQGTGQVFELPERIVGLTAEGGDLYLVTSLGEPPFTDRLWKTDGASPAVELADSLTFDLRFARLGATLYFLHGGELWRTGGTAATTERVLAAARPQETSPLVAWRGALYFFRRAEESGRELLRSDGTAAGTAVLARFAGLPEEPRLVAAGDFLLFAADDGAHGFELWATGGEAASTRLVGDLRPGPLSSAPAELTSGGSRLFFTGNDGVHGFELWASDGTAAGTRLLHDLAPEVASSSPEQLTVSGGHLFFAADDGLVRREVWSLPLAGAGCVRSATSLCLAGGRYRVEAAWNDGHGHTGQGQAVALTADTGYFWFFDPANVETIVKVLDGTPSNGHFWVYYGALSQVEYALTVTDSATGLTRRYANPRGIFASVGDVFAFGPRGAFGAGRRPAVPAEAEAAEGAGGPAGAPAATGAGCMPGPLRLCLAGGRFAVEATFKLGAQVRPAMAVPISGDTGYFWFFDAANVEVVTKVLDGRETNGKFWFFYGALSNLEYDLTVTDTQTGRHRTYHNPAGRFASAGDTQAF